MRRLTAALAAVLAAVLVLALAFALTGYSGDGPDPDQARLEVDGSAVVERADGQEEVVTDSATLELDDVVTVETGSATLEYADGATYELRAEPTASVVQIGTPPTLLAGDVLMTEGFPAAVVFEGSTITAQGAAKVDSEGPVVAAYAGRSRLAGLGDLAEVRGLRQAVLTPSAEPEPLRYDGTDPWDRRYLGEAISFGQRLEALARGYTSDLPSAGARGESFYEAVLPALAQEGEFSGRLLHDDRSPGETLIGAAIAVQGRQGTFTERWHEIFSFRDQGAAWGLVALDQGVSSAPLLETIELAVSETSSAPEPAPTTTTTTTTRPGTPEGTPPPTDPPPTTTTTTPPPEEPPDDDDGVLEPILEPVGGVLDEVLDALGLGD